MPYSRFSLTDLPLDALIFSAAKTDSIFASLSALLSVSINSVLNLKSRPCPLEVGRKNGASKVNRTMKTIKNSADERRKEICLGVDTEAMREFLSRVGDKWSLLVVVLLFKSPNRRARFSELQRNLYGISQTMLTSTLRSLERDGLITREVFPVVPPRVEYELTDLGAEIMKPMDGLLRWVTENWPRVKKARDKFDRVAKSSHAK